VPSESKPASSHLIVSVNLALPRTIQYFQHKVVTGIYKSPVTGPVMVRSLGLEDDGQADTRVFDGQQVHGGKLKAVYLYAAEHYAHWQKKLDRELPFGQFGENLTAEGISEDLVHVGDIFKLSDLTLRVTQPRTPCYKLDIRMDIPEFRHRFLGSGRSGFYAEVLQEGQVEAGGILERYVGESEQPSILSITRRYLAEEPIDS
jgi:MOSC domain-containing protein YiiM